MDFRFFIFLYVVITTVSTYSQEEQNGNAFFSSTKFKWEKWELKSSDNSKIEIINKLKSDLDEESLLNKIDIPLEKFHIIDVNSDGKEDVIYSGFLGNEKNSIILFICENEKYVEKINTFGDIIEIKQELNYLPMTFSILNSPCCEDVVYSFEEYNYFIENDKIFYNNSFKIKYLIDTIFPILNDNERYISFETTSEKYNLRNSAKIPNGNNENIVSVYPKGSFGTAIYSKKDVENDRIWWFVIMRNNKGILSTNLYDEDNSNHYTVGWMSNKMLRKIN